MTDARELLTREMIERIETCAKQQGSEPVEVLEEALNRYLAQQRLERLARRGEGLARERGIREEDVPELVCQVRQENAQRSHR